MAGYPVRVKRLATRETIQLSKIVARAVGPNLRDVDLQHGDATREGLVLIVLTAGDALEDLFVLIRDIVVPVNREDADAVRAAMVNPPLDEFIQICMTIVDQEADDLRQLVGKVRATPPMFLQSFQTGS